VSGAPIREIELDGAGIRLGQLLKYAGLADTGADAKALLVGGAVLVNGEVETRRGRQLHDGDEVRTGNDAVVVRLGSPR
jgi:ribosome-associated protein